MNRDRMVSWSSSSLARVVENFKVDIEHGLTREQIASARTHFGPNILASGKKKSITREALKQLKSPLVLVLLAALVLTLVLQKFVDAAVIFIALFINILVGVFQVERASRAFEKLKASQIRHALVVREGRQELISAEDVVPGDIIVIESGYTVPADLRLISANGLLINEASLSGESAAVMKNIEPKRSSTPITEQYNMAWMGTLVVAGTGKGIVVETGSHTQVGKIAQSLDPTEDNKTPLQQNIRRLAHFLVYVIAVAITLIFILGIFREEEIANLLFISIAVAVATMPTGLPAAVTIVLALGMESILKRGGLVRNLLAAETLGATTVILTDKTGTLTQGRMKLADLYSLTAIQNPKSSALVKKDNKKLIEVSVLASDAFIEETPGAPEPKVHGRPIERAILERGLSEGLPQNELLLTHKRLELLHFESSRRFGGSLNIAQHNKKRRLYVSGSPETLRELSSFTILNGRKVKMTSAMHEAFEKTQCTLSSQGMRLIGAAYKDVNWKKLPKDTPKKLSEELVYVGLMAFQDPPRADVPEAIQTVKNAGAEVIMLTGDNPETALSIAREAGIAGAYDTVLIGSDIERYDDEELLKILRETPVFARMLPEHKLRITRLLKARGEVVAMTGDGINDAPALASANIGIAIGSGTEVAKEASDLILLTNSFSIIVSAIEEGRKIIDNLKKIIAYLLSTSFSEIFLIGAALAIGAPLPLLPGQILWANIIQEGFMSFAFAFEKPEKGIMRRNPHSSRVKNVLTWELKTAIIVIAFITGIFLIALYFLLLRLELPIEEIRTILFAALSLDAIFFAFSLKSLRRPVWKVNLFDNKYLLVALALSVILLIAALSLAPLQTLLQLEPLSFLQVLFLFGIGLFNLATIEGVKYLIYARRKK